MDSLAAQAEQPSRRVVASNDHRCNIEEHSGARSMLAENTTLHNIHVHVWSGIVCSVPSKCAYYVNVSRRRADRQDALDSTAPLRARRNPLRAHARNHAARMQQQMQRQMQQNAATDEAEQPAAGHQQRATQRCSTTDKQIGAKRKRHSILNVKLLKAVFAKPCNILPSSRC